MSEGAPAQPIDVIDLNASEEEQRRQFQIHIVDRSQSVLDNANDKAEEIQNERANAGTNVVTRFARKLWHGNYGREFHTLNERNRGVNEIIESGNAFVLHGGKAEDDQREATAVIQSVTEGFLHQDEVRQSITEINDGAKLETELKTLVKQFAEGTLNEEALVEVKTRLLHAFGKTQNKADRTKGLLFADNVLEVAKTAKVARAHHLGLDRIDAAMSAQHTTARTGVRTQVRMNLAERAYNKLASTRLGSLVNETTLAAIVAVPLLAGKLARGSVVHTVVGAASMGTAVAVFAGLRESVHVKKDHQTHSREMAVGGNSPLANAGARREEMEATRYETVDAVDVISELSEASERARESVQRTGSAIDSIVGARALISQSDELSIDLISFSSRSKVGSERLEVDRKLAAARATVQEALNDMSDADLATLGVNTRDIGEIIDERSAAVLDLINENISSHDKAFRSLQKKRVLTAAGTAFVTATTFGLVSQEVVGALSGSVQGVFQQNSGETHRTLLAGIFRDAVSPQPLSEISPDGSNLVAAGPNANFDLPPGFQATNNDGTWELVDANSAVIDDHLSLESNGQLSDAAKDTLTAQGFNVSESTERVTDPNTYTETTVQRSPNEYIDRHPGKFTHVEREGWYANGTEVSDGNELGMWWGGENGSGIDADGNYVMSVAHMRPDGSFEGNLSANSQEMIRQGKMNIAFSMTEGTQNQVIMVHVDEHGNAVVNKNSFAGRAMFEKNDDNRAVFTGKYAETVELTEKADGVQSIRMLATVVGEDRIGTVADTTREVQYHGHDVVTTSITAPESAAADILTDIPPMVPFVARRSLEYPGKQEAGYGYGYGYGTNPNYWKRWQYERSPRLRRDPDADLNTGEELNWYRDEQVRTRGRKYVNELNGYIEENEALKAIDDSTKAIVCIPVAAASESDNIYRTLRLFAEQPDDESRDATVVLLNLNWKYDLEDKPEEMAKIQKTISEVARAQADFPHLKIAAFQKVWSKELLDKVGNQLYGEVIKVLYDTAALSMGKAVNDGKRQSDSEAMLITNDADTLGLSRNYLRNYMRTFARNPTADVFSATIRRGIESYKDYPGYGVASDFYATLNMMMQRQQKVGNGGFTTEGPNSGIRMSMYAAIGGVEARIGAGADAVLGHRIAAARRMPADKGMWSRLRKGEWGAGSDRVIGKYVVGAQLDTLPDRLLDKGYRRGLWIARGWDKFDGEDGYDDRTSGNDDPRLLKPENVETDIDGIAQRIEASVTGFAGNWYKDPAAVSSALAMTFGTNSDNKKLYDYEWDWTRENDKDGLFTFKFTDEGKEQLKNRLLRDRRGRYDPFGSRLKRQLYNETSSGAAKQPRSSESRLIS